MLYILVSLISLVVIGAASGGGGGGGGGNGGVPASLARSSFELTVNPADAAVASGESNAFKTGEYKNQIGLNKIKAAEAYQSLQGQSKPIAGDGIIIGISDGGVDLTHREIVNNANPTGQFNGTLSADDSNHGTHVASIAAGVKDGAFMHGVAFNSKIISGNVFTGDSGVNTFNSIRILSNSGAKVINMSWGSVDPTIVNSSAYVEAKNDFNSDFAAAIRNDVVLVAAAGNDGDAIKMSLPAIFAGDAITNGQMIAVAAVDDNNRLADFGNGFGSNTCTQAQNFCMVAPGKGIFAAISENPFYATFQGTSMAAPHVAGAAAVLRAISPNLTAAEIVDILFDTATDLGAPGVDNVYGHGLLNLFEAVQPQGAQSIAAGTVINSLGSRAQNSSIQTNPIFGNAYSQNLAPILKSAVFFDKYGRDYQANLDQKIATIKNDSSNLENLMFTNYSQANLPISFGDNSSASLAIKFTSRNSFSDPISGQIKTNKYGLKYLTVDKSTEDQNGFQSSDIAFSYNQNLNQNLKIGFNKNDFSDNFSWDNSVQNYNLIGYNNFASSPYKKLSLANFTSDNQSQINSNQLNIAQNLSPNLKTTLSYTSYNQSNAINRFSSDESRVVDSALSYKLNQKTTIGFGLGSLKELNNNFLGSKAQGAFSNGNNPNTNYGTFNLTRDLVDSWKLTGSYSQGKTNVSGNNLGVFRDFNNIQSRGMALGLLNDNFFNGRLAVVYSEPLRVYKGTVNIDIPISRDMEGNVQRLKADNVSLVPDGKEQDLEFAYSFRFKQNDAEIGFNSLIRQEADNVKNAKDQYLLMVKYNLKF